MDQNSPNQQYPTQPMEQQRPTSINGTKNKVGFRILFTIIALVVLFGVLNYFNILPLSSLFPNQLGWLPHKEVSNGTSQQSQQSNNVTIAPNITVPNITPHASLLNPTKLTLNNILPTILSPSLVPSSSEEIKTQNNQMATSFTSTWTANEATATAILIVTPDGKDIDQLHLSFQKDQSTPPSITTAPTITSSFFSVVPKGKWGCKPIYTSMTYCENFWEENGTKKGIGVQGLFTQGPALVNKSPEVLIFFCQRGKGNKLYSWKSCINEFSQTGVTP